MTTTLGCAQGYAVTITPRAGSGLGGQGLDVIPAAASWGRTLDAVSDAEVLVPAACCGGLADVDPWAYEMTLYRDAELCWQGPIWRITDDKAAGSLKLQARDVAAWLARRKLVAGLSVTAATDLTAIAQEVLYQAFAEDDPDVLGWVDARSTGIAIERAVEPNAAYALDELGELAKFGLNWTAIGRRLVLFGPEPLANLEPITDEDYTAGLQLTKDGDAMVTRATVTGDDGVVAVAGGVMQPWGLLDLITDVEGLTSAGGALAVAESQLSGATPAPILIAGTDGALRPTAPVALADLVPGAVGAVLVRGVCMTVNQLVRLEQLKVEWVPGQELVKPGFTPIGVR